MTVMNEYTRLKATRDMHINMSRCTLYTQELRDIHTRHAREFQGMIDELAAGVTRGLGWSVGV